MPEQIRCINFYGIETEKAAPVCSWVHPPFWYLQRLKDRLNINTVRIPFSYQYISSHDLSELDELVDDAESLNITVILDWHRNYHTNQSPTPETGISLDVWHLGWVRLLSRFQDRPIVQGVALFNEMQVADSAYTNRIQTDLINHLETQFPGRFTYIMGCPKWGGDCTDVDISEISAAHVLVDVHKYFFQGNSTPTNWDTTIPKRIPPQQWFIGETGWKQNIPQERDWGNSFVHYLQSRGIDNLCFWTIAHSGDTGGLWQDDCLTYEWEKSAQLGQVWIRNQRMPDRQRLRGKTSLELPPLNQSASNSIADCLVGSHCSG